MCSSDKRLNSLYPLQEFNCILSILSAILNIGDIRIEGEAHPHVGEVGVVGNTDRINDGTNIVQYCVTMVQSQ